MRTIVRMQMDVGANMRGELAGFTPERAAELVRGRQAEVVCEFNPETHRFDAATAGAVELDFDSSSAQAAHGRALEEVSELQAEIERLKGSIVDQAQVIDGLREEVAHLKNIEGALDQRVDELKADLAAAESLLSGAAAPAVAPAEPTQS